MRDGGDAARRVRSLTVGDVDPVGSGEVAGVLESQRQIFAGPELAGLADVLADERGTDTAETVADDAVRLRVRGTERTGELAVLDVADLVGFEDLDAVRRCVRVRQLATVKDGYEVAAEMCQLVEHLTEKLVERDAAREFRVLRPLAECIRSVHVDGAVGLDDREPSADRADDIVAKLKGGRW